MFTIQMTNMLSFNTHATPTKETLLLSHGMDEETELTNTEVSELGLKTLLTPCCIASGRSSGKCHLPAPRYISGGALAPRAGS